MPLTYSSKTGIVFIQQTCRYSSFIIFKQASGLILGSGMSSFGKLTKFIDEFVFVFDL